MGTSTSSRPLWVLPCFILTAFIFNGTPRISAQEQAPDLVLTRAADAQLDSLAFRVDEKIKQNNRGQGPTKVLVVDFTWKSPEISSRLGTLLADRFSEMLKMNSNGVDVMDRKLLKDYLRSSNTNIEDLHTNTACMAVAEDLGATQVIRANLVEDKGQQLKIQVQLSGLEIGFFDEAQFVITKDMEDMLSQPGPSYSRAPDSIPAEPGILVLGSKSVEGVSSPSCITCPDPAYTTTANSAKLQGTVALSAVITTTGEVTSIYVVKGLPLGLTQRAIDTIRKWKLKPAIKDGNPIPVRVDIETTFRFL